ncbi:hypothetical protein WN944_003143 [Citrus x changshan-huyou]|uniref:Uncharacterized protein n=1 Tax=Citrus x changshan-huyou TaxID=2935761 RepID=A0AAP0QKV3_9ROSI
MYTNSSHGAQTKKQKKNLSALLISLNHYIIGVNGTETMSKEATYAFQGETNCPYSYLRGRLLLPAIADEYIGKKQLMIK